MGNKRVPRRSLDEWMALVTECGQRRLTNSMWCNEHGSLSAVFIMQLPICVKKSLPDARTTWKNLDNSHTIEIEAKGLQIRMSNTIQPVLLEILMDALKKLLCWRIFQMSMQSISSVAYKHEIFILTFCKNVDFTVSKKMRIKN